MRAYSSLQTGQIQRLLGERKDENSSWCKRKSLFLNTFPLRPIIWRLVGLKILLLHLSWNWFFTDRYVNSENLFKKWKQGLPSRRWIKNEKQHFNHRCLLAQDVLTWQNIFGTGYMVHGSALELLLYPKNWSPVSGHQTWEFCEF